MNRFYLLLIIAIILSISGCIQQQSQSVPVINEGETSTTGKLSSNIISIQNSGFDPAEITIKKGSNVTWINLDKTSHTVTSSTGEFDSGQLQTGAKYAHEFDNVGTYEYYCTINPSMKGKLTVND